MELFMKVSQTSLIRICSAVRDDMVQPSQIVDMILQRQGNHVALGFLEGLHVDAQGKRMPEPIAAPKIHKPDGLIDRTQSAAQSIERLSDMECYAELPFRSDHLAGPAKTGSQNFRTALRFIICRIDPDDLLAVTLELFTQDRVKQLRRAECGNNNNIPCKVFSDIFQKGIDLNVVC